MLIKTLQTCQGVDFEFCCQGVSILPVQADAHVSQKSLRVWCEAIATLISKMKSVRILVVTRDQLGLPHQAVQLLVAHYGLHVLGVSLFPHLEPEVRQESQRVCVQTHFHLNL